MSVYRNWGLELFERVVRAILGRVAEPQAAWGQSLARLQGAPLPPDVKESHGTASDTVPTKRPRSRGHSGLYRISLEVVLVEAAGVEPASVGTRLLALHA